MSSRLVRVGAMSNVFSSIPSFSLFPTSFPLSFLLYESMLPSVLHARDLYLSPSIGVLAPSHCRMTLALMSDQEFVDDKINFWKDVHGFKMNSMIQGCYDEAYVEILKPESLVSNVVDIYDLPLQVLESRQPEFKSPFELTISGNGNSNEEIEIQAFVSWFDTWFCNQPPNAENPQASHPVPINGKKAMKGGEILKDLPECRIKPIEEKEVLGLKLKENQVVEHEDGKGNSEVVSFTTGPMGKPTHWKQSVFLLKEAIVARKGELSFNVCRRVSLISN